jgi:predicted nuclease with TOPRIM domain
MIVDLKLIFKALAIFLSVVLIILCMKLYNLNRANTDIEKAYQNKMEELRNLSDSKIKNYEAEIQSKKGIILQLEEKQAQYEHSLDSLKAVKQKIKTVYRDRVIEVKNFDSQQIEDYWKNKFNSEF